MDVLKAGGWPASPANQKFLNGWQAYEQSVCRNNPLNTTLVYSGSVTCNFAGVQSYSTQAIGAAATVRTLKNGNYPALVAALATGDPYSYTDPNGVAANVTKWGTPNFAAAYLLAAGSVAGSGGSAPATLGQSELDSSTASGHKGYADLRNSLARHLPTQLERSQRTGRATLQELAHGRKVKG